MSTWNSLYGTKGEYQSVVIDASSNFDYYIMNVSANYIENDGTVEVFIRSSHDGGVTWGNWYNIIDDMKKVVFDGEGIRMNNTKFQFKVTMDLGNNVLGVSPIFNQLSVVLLGAYKIDNTGDVDCLPEMWFKKYHSFGDITLTNETTGQTLILKDINDSEEIYVDNENKDIITNLPLTYRYSNHNKEWLRLQDGENIITGIGRFKLDVRHEFKVLQG